MKNFEWRIQNTIYLIIAIIAIIAFLIVFRVDQLARCQMIATNSSYTKLIDNVYVPSDMPKARREEVLGFIEEAIKRNTELYGELIGEGIFIFADSLEEAENFRGSTVGVTHYSVFGLFVIIGPNGYNSDIVSHEMAHSEIASRIGWYKNNKLPIWFNEGLATQVDLREQFSLEKWNYLTENGEDIYEIKNLDTPKEFYVYDFEKRIDNYLYAKHEVRKWLEVVGKEGLKEIINDFASGSDFYDSYTKILLKNVMN